MKKIFYLLLAVSIVALSSCGEFADEPVSSSGVERAQTEVSTLSNGHTVEQQNIIDRLTTDNTPGSIKHLYIISAYSGDVLMYSTVRGKVTSSGKRLTPNTVIGLNQYTGIENNTFSVGSGISTQTYATDEMIQDDGTFGSSAEYIFWFDSRGIYHQQYITGGMILHVSSEPIAVNKVILNLETANE